MEMRDRNSPLLEPNKRNLPKKIPSYKKSLDFSPKIAEIRNLGTNSPKVGILGVRVDVYAYYANKLRQNVGLET